MKAVGFEIKIYNQSGVFCIKTNQKLAVISEQIGEYVIVERARINFLGSDLLLSDEFFGCGFEVSELKLNLKKTVVDRM